MFWVCRAGTSASALPYQCWAQEPLIDNMTQMLHWTKHTATYFENVNKAIKPFPALQVRHPLVTFHACLGLHLHV